MIAHDLVDRLADAAIEGGTYSGQCPVDGHGRLRFSNGREQLRLRCDDATCSPEQVAAALGVSVDELVTINANGRRPDDHVGLTLDAYAEAKRLPEEFLTGLGLKDVRLRDGTPAVRMLYRDTYGAESGTRYRIALSGDKFRWKKGTKPTLYGMWLLDTARQVGYIVVVEGESDAHTLWHHRRPALGLPGAGTWRDEWASHFDDIDRVFVVQEPDGAGAALVTKLGESPLRDRLHIVTLGAHKDVSALHIADPDPEHFRMRLDAALDGAVPFVEWERQEKEREAFELRERCASVLAHPDPLELIKAELARLGYGGVVAPAEIVYLSMTSRVLTMRPGAMPVHLLILGAPSSGKSWTLAIVLALLPVDSFVKIDAGSPRALIYSDADLRHRLVIFSEVDSLPAGEDNPAASAFRTLLQEGHLAYDVVVKGADGKFTVQHVRKPGPTVLLTAGVKRLGEQMDTRVFTLETPEDVARTRAALVKQAELELHPPAAPDPGLIAFQSYLQALAPWHVVVPYAQELAAKIGRSITEPRVVRDFAKLMSLIKSIAVMRHPHRDRDADGRLVAILADYRTARELVNPIYEATTTGASVKMHEIVQAVRDLVKVTPGETRKPVTVTALARHLKIAPSSASARVKRALSEGWLKNEGAWREGTGFDLRLGDELPPSVGLPEPENLGVCDPPETGRTPERSLRRPLGIR